MVKVVKHLAWANFLRMHIFSGCLDYFVCSPLLCTPERTAGSSGEIQRGPRTVYETIVVENHVHPRGFLCASGRLYQAVQIIRALRVGLTGLRLYTKCYTPHQINHFPHRTLATDLLDRFLLRQVYHTTPDKPVSPPQHKASKIIKPSREEVPLVEQNPQFEFLISIMFGILVRFLA